MLRLTLRDSSPIPLELEGITPDRLQSLLTDEIARISIFHGNRAEPLGEFFDVTGDPSDGRLHLSGDTGRVKQIGAKMKAGSIYVENSVGMHAGAGMSGGHLTIDSDAGDWLGAEMKGGEIEVRGDAGNQVGAAYRGSRRGMCGGVIVCKGQVGDELGLLMRRGLIVVEGGCGEFAGALMIAGTIFVLGKAGARLGAGMKRGTVFAAGGVEEQLLSFRYSCDYQPTFLPLYQTEMKKLGLTDLGDSENRLWRCYRGDMLYGGRGELFLPG